MRVTNTILFCFAGLPLLAGTADASPIWHVGEPVVCVNNRFLDLSDAPELVEGRTYTIADIWPARRGHLGLEVAEVGAKPRFLAFDERRFVPALTTAAFAQPPGT